MATPAPAIMDLMTSSAVSGEIHDFAPANCNSFGADCTGVFKQTIRAARPRSKIVHRLLNDGGTREIERIRSFPRLEENIGVLGCTAQDWTVGRQRTVAVKAL